MRSLQLGRGAGGVIAQPRLETETPATARLWAAARGSPGTTLARPRAGLTPHPPPAPSGPRGGARRVPELRFQSGLRHRGSGAAEPGAGRPAHARRRGPSCPGTRRQPRVSAPAALGSGHCARRPRGRSAPVCRMDRGGWGQRGRLYACSALAESGEAVSTSASFLSRPTSCFALKGDTMCP